MIRRHELTDGQWQVIEPLLPASGVRGRPRVDDRQVINGMLFKAKTGVAWRDLPERYGPWKTVYNRFWRWSRNGTLATLVGQVRVVAEAVDELDREVQLDSSIVRVHQHAAGARHAPPAILLPLTDTPEAALLATLAADAFPAGQLRPFGFAAQPAGVQIGREAVGPLDDLGVGVAAVALDDELPVADRPGDGGRGGGDGELC